MFRRQTFWKFSVINIYDLDKMEDLNRDLPKAKCLGEYQIKLPCLLKRERKDAWKHVEIASHTIDIYIFPSKKRHFPWVSERISCSYLGHVSDVVWLLPVVNLNIRQINTNHINCVLNIQHNLYTLFLPLISFKNPSKYFSFSLQSFLMPGVW